MLSFSVSEISVGKASKILSFLPNEIRMVQNKNGTTKASSLADISVTEKLTNTYFIYSHFELLSLSVAEISVEEENLVMPFLFSTTRLSAHKNDWNALPTDISATERLSTTKYC